MADVWAVRGDAAGKLRLESWLEDAKRLLDHDAYKELREGILRLRALTVPTANREGSACVCVEDILRRFAALLRGAGFAAEALQEGLPRSLWESWFQLTAYSNSEGCGTLVAPQAQGIDQTERTEALATPFRTDVPTNILESLKVRQRERVESVHQELVDVVAQPAEKRRRLVQKEPPAEARSVALPVSSLVARLDKQGSVCVQVCGVYRVANMFFGCIIVILEMAVVCLVASRSTPSGQSVTCRGARSWLVRLSILVLPSMAVVGIWLLRPTT